MRAWRLLTVTAIGLVAAVVLLYPRPSAAEPELVQYQGRLTDANGRPLEGTVARLTFRMYSTASPSSASFVWGEVHEDVEVRRGVFTVFLGGGDATIDASGDEAPGPNPLTAPTFSGGDRFVEVQVESDAPLSPLVRLGAVPFAFSTAGTVPIGGIVEWYRPTPDTDVPDGWAVCDGSVVSDPDSPLDGQPTPDLVGRFVRGLGTSALQDPTSYGGGTATSLPDAGGVEQHDLGHRHSVSLPSHRHSISSDGGHSHTVPGQSVETGFISTCDPNRVTTCAAFFGGNLGDHRHDVAIPSVATQSAGSHSHGGDTGSSGGGTRNTTNELGTVDNRPPFVGLVKIIRIR